MLSDSSLVPAESDTCDADVQTLGPCQYCAQTVRASAYDQTQECLWAGAESKCVHMDAIQGQQGPTIYWW